MTIENGKIIRHLDDFNFWRWSHQAIGLAGVLLGWSLFFKNSVRRGAAKSLASFEQKENELN